MIAIYENEVVNNTLSATSENVLFPLENLQDTLVYTVYRSTSNAAQRIVISGTSIAAKYVFLKNYNFTSGATIRIEANTSDSWGSPAFTQTLTYDSEYIYEAFSSLQTYDYWSLYVDDTSNTDSFIQLGLFILGDAINLGGMKKDQSIDDVTSSIAQFTTSGQLYGNEDIVYRTARINTPFLDTTERDTARTMFRAVKNITPILLLIWENDLTLEEPIYCNVNLQNVQYKRNEDNNKLWSISFDFRETF